jgi:hypothetical protein
MAYLQITEVADEHGKRRERLLDIGPALSINAAEMDNGNTVLTLRFPDFQMQYDVLGNIDDLVAGLKQARASGFGRV